MNEIYGDGYVELPKLSASLAKAIYEADLWDIQLENYPDSVRFTHNEVMRAWMCDEHGYVTANQQFVTSVLSAVLQHPDGVFYTCHAGKDYGYRYGKEGSQYFGFHNGTAQPTQVTHDFDMQTRTMWYVMGIPQTWYDTKMCAERAARMEFPDEDPDKRYARVGYREFLEGEMK